MLNAMLKDRKPDALADESIIDNVSNTAGDECSYSDDHGFFSI